MLIIENMTIGKKTPVCELLQKIQKTYSARVKRNEISFWI